MKDLPSMPKLVDMLGFPRRPSTLRSTTTIGSRGDCRSISMTAVIGFGCLMRIFPRMSPELPEIIVRDAIGRLEDKGLLRMVHYGRLSRYAIDRVRRRVV